jgi:hypothetical protein
MRRGQQIWRKIKLNFLLNLFDDFRLLRGRRKYFDRLEDLPENVVAERREKMNKLPEEIFE